MQSLVNLETLLKGDLADQQARQLLLDLTPEKMTLAELTRIVQTLRSYRNPDLNLSFDRQRYTVLDCCGTGGSGLPHFNVSTTSAFVIASAGVPVVKFGNRASTSESGSFDLLTSLHFSAELPFHKHPNLVEDLLNDCGLVFLYAPQIYPALSKLAPLRRTLGVKTVFNFVGPLLNPVDPPLRLLGVSDDKMHGLMAEYLSKQPENQLAWVVTGSDGQDEICVSAQTTLSKVSKDTVEDDQLMPSKVLPADTMDTASRFQAILSGEDTSSRAYHDVCLNAGAALCIAGKAPDMPTGTIQAQELLASGTVFSKFEQIQRRYERFI